MIATIVLVILCGSIPAHAQTLKVLYVDDDKSGTDCTAGEGTGWRNAFTELQDALDCMRQQIQQGIYQCGSTHQCEIWVAEGQYRPDYDPITNQPTDLRSSSFELIDHVGIYGAFKGLVEETSVASRQGLPQFTVLTGRIGDPDELADNSCHVVKSNPGISPSAILDSFSITGGYAFGACDTHYGGGMYVDQSDPSIQECTFAANSAYVGGGLANFKGTPLMTSVTFISNGTLPEGANTSKGGGMWTFDDRDVGDPEDPPLSFPIDSALFHGNRANAGGGLYIEGSSRPFISEGEFRLNTATSGDGGGAAVESIGAITKYSLAEFSQCTFYNNTAQFRGGGLFEFDTQVAVDFCVFGDVVGSGNTAVQGGGMASIGSLSVFEQHEPSIFLSSFEYNEATYGGGIATFQSKITITDTAFTHNGSLCSGGGLYLAKSIPTVTGGTVAYNHNDENTYGDPSVQCGGGGVACEGSACALYGIQILTNEAAGWGGGILLYGDNGGDGPTVTACHIKNANTARHGGGLYLWAGAYTIDESFIENNIALLDGGGVYNDGGVSDTSITDTHVTANHSDGDGGGIFTRSAVPRFENLVVSANTAVDRGGGMYVSSGLPYTLLCAFRNNEAGHGGGIFVEDLPQNNALLLLNCELSGNKAVYNSQNEGDDGDGGGIYLKDSLTLQHELWHCTFFNNEAKGDGGGIYLANDGLDGTDIRGNILWRNKGNTDGIPVTDETAQIYEALSTTPAVQYSCIGDEDPDDGDIPYDDGTNIDDDPKFVSEAMPDLHLKYVPGNPSEQSPALDAGHGTWPAPGPYVPAGLDLDGKDRCVELLPSPLGVACTEGAGDVPDMGAYEVQIEDIECDSFADCADLNGDGKRDLVCTWWACVNDSCQVTAKTQPADIGGEYGACPIDGTCDGNDRFHAINCFANTNGQGGTYPCEENPPIAYNVDAGGAFSACELDGVCDGNDAFHALNCFAGTSTCTCGPGEGAAPDSPMAFAGELGLLVVADRPVIAPGEIVEVHVFISNPVDHVLLGYQLHSVAAGGLSGNMDLVDMVVYDRDDYIFKNVEHNMAFNIGLRQMFVGVDENGLANAGDVDVAGDSEVAGYLATLVYQASDDSKGSFTIDLMAGADLATNRTFAFGVPAGTMDASETIVQPVDLTSLTGAVIVVE
jgi:hypothetical protein